MVNRDHHESQENVMGFEDVQKQQQATIRETNMVYVAINYFLKIHSRNGKIQKLS